MIIFDASYLVVFLNKDPAPAIDRQGNPVTRFKERVEYLASSINASGEQIGIPTPALAEVLVKSGKGRSQFVSTLSDGMRFQLLPFDARAAIEAAELIALIKSKRESWGTHAKVKFDIQIVATAKAEDATIIYSDDQDIERFAKRFKIPVKRICDLDLPPSKEFPEIESGPIGEQRPLFDLASPLFESNPDLMLDRAAKVDVIDGPRKPAEESKAGKPESDSELEANPASPAVIQGSDDGGDEGDATPKGSTQKTAEMEPPRRMITLERA
jgi:predicted nucleic acid-binding protein